jgi:hypothetical protein
MRSVVRRIACQLDTEQSRIVLCTKNPKALTQASRNIGESKSQCLGDLAALSADGRLDENKE